MRTHIATGTLLVALAAVALAAVALAPAASAGPLFVEADVYGQHVEYENNGILCKNAPFSIGPAFHPQVYSTGDCDVHVVYP